MHLSSFLNLFRNIIFVFMNRNRVDKLSSKVNVEPNNVKDDVMKKVQELSNELNDVNKEVWGLLAFGVPSFRAIKTTVQ